MELVLEIGVEDFEYGVGEKKDETNVCDLNFLMNIQVICARNDLIKVKNSIENKGLTTTNAQIVAFPTQTVPQLESEAEEQFNLLLDALEDLEDVSRVTHNFQPSE